ncbi:MAG TPA: cell division protein FtsA [Hyphomonadaceae bacterium]|nr:cell division protein FtsA [Hyphomonadaceae bacterium]
MSSLAQRTNVRDRAHARGTVMAALDIGSSKVTCMISRRGDATDGEPRVAGAGAQGTKGVRSGAVVDLDNLERSIRLAVEQAERAADLRITDVVLGVSGPDLRSDVVRAKLPMVGREITAAHIRDARIAALESFQSQGREILHSAPLGFTVDSTGGVKDPRGMFAETLTASYLVVSAPTAGLRNIVQCVSRAHLQPTAILAAPFAAGLACLVEDEAEQGAMVIDFGAGVTSAAAFCDGGLVHVETLPMGGSRATSDLAQGLGTTFAAAERMKTLHGAVGLSEVGALDMVEAPRLGPDGRLEAHQCSKADIAQVLRPRIEEILELMDGRLSKASAAGRPLPRRIVLTGGSSQLPSLQELAEDVFRAPVRLARPANVKGLGETYSSPAFAAAAGLLRWELMGGPDPSRSSGDRAAMDHGSGLMKRVFGWVQENF